VLLSQQTDAATNSDGLVGLSLAYRSATKSFLARAALLADRNSLRLILDLVPSGFDEITSRASDAVQLAVPGDAALQRACVAIVPDRNDAPSVALFSAWSAGPLLDPDRRGGGAFVHPVAANTSQQV